MLVDIVAPGATARIELAVSDGNTHDEDPVEAPSSAAPGEVAESTGGAWSEASRGPGGPRISGAGKGKGRPSEDGEKGPGAPVLSCGGPASLASWPSAEALSYTFGAMWRERAYRSGVRARYLGAP